MSQRFTIIATVTTPLEAQLLKARLEDEGLVAFVSDAEIVTADWTMSNAIGGVKVLVAAEDTERARTLLAEPVEELEDYEGPTEAESLAQRALFAAMLGNVVPPMHLYTLYVLWRYHVTVGGKTARTQRLVRGAVLLMLPLLTFVASLLMF